MAEGSNFASPGCKHQHRQSGGLSGNDSDLRAPGVVKSQQI